MRNTVVLVISLSACLVLPFDGLATESVSESASRKPFPGFETRIYAADLNVLKKEFVALEPFNVTATNFTVLKLSSGGVIVGCRDVGLRIERFLCAEPETELGWVRGQLETNGCIRVRHRIERVRDDATVEKGRARNGVARRVFAEFLSEPHPEASKEVQEFWLLAATSVWIDGVSGSSLFRESESTARRRAEDGIPSAEAILEWFAENDSFCESVRSQARARFERMKAPPPPK